jgi:hypothetical protein
MPGFRPTPRKAQPHGAAYALSDNPPKAIGPESEIEPWLAVANPLLADAREAAGKNAKDHGSEVLSGKRKEDYAPARSAAAANGGWMSEKIFLRAIRIRGRVFSLDIPFYRTRQLARTSGQCACEMGKII